MKKIIAIVAFLVFAGTVSAKTNLRVFDLTCEHLTNPLGIDVETPRFSWKLYDPAHTRGQHQTAYRILVATTPDKLKNSKADVWDSGIVASEQSHLVSYNGIKLQSGEDYYWKVMIYDVNKKASAWSKTARFSMGLTERNDWKGEWIKHPSASPEKHIRFRKTLTLDEKALSAFVYIASVGYHELYVNGQKADERVLAPAISRIDKRILYVTYDIAPLLQKGENVIAVWYGAGWSRNNFFASSVNQTVLLQLNGKTSKGDTFSLHSGETWKCAESYGSYSGLFDMFDMGGESMDGRSYSKDWNTTGFDDSQWIAATKTTPLKDGKDLILSAQMTDPSRIIETLPARSVTDTIPGVWRVDMGKSFTGFIEAGFDGLQAGDTVLIQISNRTNAVEEHKQRCYYIARGENGETFRNHFNFFGGRYIHFTGLKQAPKMADIKGYAVSSAGKRTGYFECSDPMFNQIYETDRWTYEMCNTEGVTVDCPNRERLGYGPEGAYQTTWGLGLPSFASAAYYIKNVRDWSDVQNPDGSINNVAPQISRMYGGALNGGAHLNIAWEHYLSHGDKQILEKAYKTSEKWLAFLEHHVSEGLLTPYEQGGFFLGEWVSPGNLAPVFELGDTQEALFFNNCVYAMTLNFFIQISEVLGRGDEIAPYRERLAILRTKIHEKYFNPAINSYLKGDQVRTAFALYAGIVPDALQASVVEHLEKDMTGEHPYFNIGSFVRYPYFHVLFAYPQFQEIISDILSKTTYPGYGYFLTNGQTTWPETWDMIYPESALIHTSYAGISAWFIKSLAGIEPSTDDPGYRTVIIRPNVIQKLDYAKAGLESPYGLIESGWHKENGKVIYNITIPAGSKATVYLPVKVAEITENGRPLAKAAGIRIAEKSNSHHVIIIESGKYRFEANNE